MTGECSRCGECCRYLPLLISRLDPPYLNYLRCRGLKEDQGFILIPHDCQHLQHPISDREIVLQNMIAEGLTTNLDFIDKSRNIIARMKKEHPDHATTYSCDIHDSPDRPAICQKFRGQKRIGNAMIYIPPGCTMRKKE